MTAVPVVSDSGPEHDIVLAGSSRILAEPGRGGGGVPAQQSLPRVVHRLLRGRYPVVIALALLGGIGGAVGGYFLQTPKYKCDGQVEVQPTIPKILYQTEQSSVSPMFSNFLNTQVSLLQQDRVIRRAMDSEDWRALGRGRGPEDEADFRKGLKVATIPNTFLINVSFTDQESRATLVAVREVINAYKTLFGHREEENVTSTRLSTLKSLQKQYESDRKDLQTQVLSKSSEFESDDLTRLQDHYLTQLLAVDSRAAETKAQLTQLGIDPDKFALPSTGSTDPGSPKSVPAPTAEQIAVTDPAMAALLAQQSTLKRRLASNRARGLGDQHPAIIMDQTDLAAVEADIAQMVEKYKDPASAPASASTVIAAGPPRPDQLVVQYRLLQTQAKQLRDRTSLISTRRIEIDGLNRDIQALDAKLAEVNRRLDEINVESNMRDTVGRIDTQLPEAAPGTPNVDPRKKMAAFGLVLGGGLPIAVMLLVGLIDRRFRFADQARDASHAAPLLGILPELPLSGGDPERSAAAVHCVHHIRSLLQMTKRDHKVIAVTSPAAGDGKTSLALSLAMSFTASGSRTLLMDFDLIGCGLTARLNAKRSEGLGHALVAGAGNGHVVPSGVPGLDLLPAGRDDARHISRISRSAFEAVLDEYRGKYDAIIVDTGPAMGSLEANIAATSADGVVLVVGRGQHGDRVQEVLRHLDQLGAGMLGMVFNRAHATDFARSTMSKSMRSVRSDDAPRRPDPVPAEVAAIAPSDPLARSVVSDIQD